MKVEAKKKKKKEVPKEPEKVEQKNYLQRWRDRRAQRRQNGKV